MHLNTAWNQCLQPASDDSDPCDVKLICSVEQMTEIGTIEDFDYRYTLIKCFDLLIMLQFWVMNYQKITW